jgi:4'-phosphopantetheinyl transferase
VRVGADVEREREVPGLEHLVERFFSGEERRRLLALPAARRRAVFFRLWARKEAAAKALGLGILEFLRTAEAARLARSARSARLGCWRVSDLEPAPGYTGALCREGRGAIAGCWIWREPWAAS